MLLPFRQIHYFTKKAKRKKLSKWPDLKLLSYLENDWYYHQLAHTRKVKHREIEPKDWVSIDTQEGKTYYSDFTVRWEESWKQDNWAEVCLYWW